MSKPKLPALGSSPLSQIQSKGCATQRAIEKLIANSYFPVTASRHTILYDADMAEKIATDATEHRTRLSGMLGNG